MNKIFKVIWSHATQNWVVVSELNVSRGKTKSASGKSPKVATAIAIAAAALSGTALGATSSGTALGTTTSGASLGTISSSNQHFISVAAVTDNPSTEGNYNNNMATAKGAVAIGAGASASAEKSVAIGAGASASAEKSGAIGEGSQITDAGANSYAIGSQNKIGQANTFVLGNNVVTTQANSVVLGNNSTDRAATVEDQAVVNKIRYQNFAGNKTQAGQLKNATDIGVVSVGSQYGERQIINVAPGNISASSTDAINGSQLYVVANNLRHQMTTLYTKTDGTELDRREENNGKYDCHNTVKEMNGSVIGHANCGRSIEIVASMRDRDGSTTTPFTLTNVKKTLPDTHSFTTDPTDSTKTGLTITKFHELPNLLETSANHRNKAWKYNNAASIRDVLNTGWNLRASDEAVDFVKPYDTVHFTSPDKSVVITSSSDGNVSTINFTVASSSSSSQLHFLSTKGSSTTPETQDNYLNNGANAFGSLAFGVNASTAAGATSGIAMGDTAKVEGKRSIAIGPNANASVNVAIAVGSNAQTHGEHGVALGENSKVAEDSEYGIAVGADSVATGARDIFIGRKAGQGATHKEETQKNYNNIGIGESAGTNVSGANIIAIGTNSADGLKGSNSIAIGSGANSKVTLGLTEEITTDFNVAIGERTLASGGGSTALGYFANSTGSLASALGNSANAVGNYSAAVGPKANATKEAATAMGYLAEASGHSAFAGGHGAKAQANHTVALGTLSKAGKEYAIALGYNAESKEGSAIAMGNRAKASGVTSIALGVAANATVTNAIAIGTQAKATDQGSVALGFGSETAPRVNTENATVNGIKYGDFAGKTAYATVSVGSDTKQRTITNVAAGRISATSTDAINGSQLYMTQQALGNVAKTTANHLGGGSTVNQDGTLTAPSYELVVGNPKAGDNANIVGQAGKNPASNVGDAFSNLNAYINKGFDIRENGTDTAPNKKATVTPGEAVNFVNGGNTRARVAQEGEKGITNITFDITGLPIQYTTADGNPVAKVGDKYYQVKEDGTPDLTKPVEDADVAKLKISAINPAAKPNQTGNAVILDNVKSGLKPYSETTANTDSPIAAPNPKAGLVDLNTKVNGQPISANTVATVGDLRNMGWVIGTPDNKAEHAVKNAELLNFKGSDGIHVKGKTNATTGAFEVEFGLSATSRIELEKKPRSGTASEFTGRVKVAEDDPNNGTGFVSAKSVIDAINDSGWNLNASAAVGGELVDGSDKDTELIKPGREVNLQAGHNLKVERKGANISFATKENVSFTSVSIGAADKEIKLTAPVANPNTLNFAGKEGAPVVLTNVKSGASAFGPQQGIINGLLNLDSLYDQQGNLIDSGMARNVATLGDLARMGFVVKTPENGYAEQVRNAEVVNFIGSGAAQVQGGRIVDGEATIVVHVQAQEVINNAQLPVAYTNKDGDKLVKIGDKFYKADDVTEIDNKAYPKDSVRAADGNIYPAGTQLNEDGLPVDSSVAKIEPLPQDSDKIVQPADIIASMNNGSNDTKVPMQLGNVAKGAKVFGPNLFQPTQDTPEAKAMAQNLSNAFDGLADLRNSNPTNVMTVADARNMGWVISTLHGNGYADDVRNANHVDFVGTGLATVKGHTDERTGIRVVTVDVNSQNVVQDAQLPVVYTTQDGERVVKVGDKFYKDGDVLVFDGKVYPKGSVVAADGKVYPEGTKLGTDHLPTDSNVQAISPMDGGTVEPQNLIASMNNGNNDTKAPMKLGNVGGNLAATYNVGDKVIGADGKPTDQAATAPTKEQAAPSAEEAAKMYNNAATVGDVLNAGWNLQANGEAADFVKPYDTVNFKGEGLAKVRIETSDDGKTSNVIIKVDGASVVDNVKGDIKVNDGREADKPKGSVSTPDTGDNKLATTKQVADAINGSGWVATVTATEGGVAEGASDELVNPGEKVTFEAGKNIKLKQEGGKFTIATKDQLELGKADQTGKPGEDGAIKVNAKDGSSATLKVEQGPKGLDGNDGEAGKTKTRIVYVKPNGKKEQVATLEDGLRFAGDKGDEVKRPLNSVVNIKGGADLSKTKLTEGNIGVETQPNTGTLQVKLAKDINLGNDGSLNVGGVKIDQNGINVGDKVIQGVKDGTAPTDAVNKRQLDLAMNNVNNHIQKMDKDLRGGVAGALAAAGLYHVTLPGKSMVAAGVGTYQGQSAVAVGYSRLSDNGKMGVKFTINANTRGQTGASASVGYQW